jgi:hypothetical protein
MKHQNKKKERIIKKIELLNLKQYRYRREMPDEHKIEL